MFFVWSEQSHEALQKTIASSEFASFTVNELLGNPARIVSKSDLSAVGPGSRVFSVNLGPAATTTYKQAP